MTNWTEEQLSFIKAVSKEDEAISLRAVAGSGKTTTLVGAVNALMDSAPFADTTCVAFNKAIADTLGQRMPPSVACKTMNALGHASWARHLQGVRPQVDTRKFWTLLHDVYGSDYQLSDELEDMPRLFSLVKQAGLVPPGWLGKAALGVCDETTIRDLLDHYDLMIPEELEAEAHRMVVKLLSASIQAAMSGLIDFNDQLYMPVCFGGSFQRNDFVFIDEAQDISPIQMEILAIMVSHSGRLHAVGDPHQAIYGFRGATSGSMRYIQERFGQGHMSLTYTFRCSKAVTREAARIVPDIKCPENAADGSVSSWTRATIEDIAFPMEVTRPEHTAIICRNTRPLVDLAFRLIRRRIPCYVAGRDIGKSLASLVDKMKAKSADDLIIRLQDWARRECERAISRGAFAKADSIRDRVDSLIAVADECDSVADVKQNIHKMFQDPDTSARRITLSTIHKAKGLEWDTVFFLDPDLLPSPFATSKWQLEQEENLSYVAVTRALRDLVYIYSDGLE